MAEALQCSFGGIFFTMLGEPPWRSIFEVRLAAQGLELTILLRDERDKDKRGESKPQLSKKDTPVSPAVRS